MCACEGVCVSACVCIHLPVCILLCLTCRNSVSSSFFLPETLWATWLSSGLCSKNLLRHICLLSSVLCLHSPFTGFDLHTTASYCLCVCRLKGSIIHLSTMPQQQTPGCIQNSYRILKILCLVTNTFCVLSLKWCCWEIICVKFLVFCCLYYQRGNTNNVHCCFLSPHLGWRLLFAVLFLSWCLHGMRWSKHLMYFMCHCALCLKQSGLQSWGDTAIQMKHPSRWQD